MENFKKKLPTYVFTVIETTIIFLVGIYINVDYKSVILIMMSFAITKLSIIKLGIAKSMHYKKVYKCIIWSLLVLLSLFVVAKASLILSIIMAIFTSIIISNKCDVKNINSKIDIKDIYLWSGRASKYEALKDFVALSPNNPIILEHESYWIKNYPIRYEIFKYYFRENKSYQEIAEIKGFDDNTITKRECATIYSVLERPLNLPPINK